MIGGEGNEAMEIGLQLANQEIRGCNETPLSMIIIIGDAAPNTIDEVRIKREKAAISMSNLQYWDATKYAQSTYWEKEMQEIKEAEVPVNCV